MTMHGSPIGRRDLLRLLAALGAGAIETGGALAQTSSGAVNAGGRIVFENDKVRVIEHLAKPRLGVCGAGMHSHPPHLSICLTDVKARVTLPGRDPFIAENKAGDVFWDPGGAHIVENMGSRESRAYLVELKGTA
jgi:hypothetical protein